MTYAPDSIHSLLACQKLRRNVHLCWHCKSQSLSLAKVTHVLQVLRLDAQMQKLAEELKHENSLLVFGRGYNYATALEAALKVRFRYLCCSAGNITLSGHIVVLDWPHESFCRYMCACQMSLQLDVHT